MGMDGLSMSNTGMLREATSKDYAIQTEEHVEKEDKNKQVGQLSTQMKVKEDGHKRGDSQEEKEEKDDEASVYEKSENEVAEQEDRLEIPKEELENYTFYVKISKDGELFELYDKASDRLVEKISASEINQLMLKLNMASGILVNRSV